MMQTWQQTPAVLCVFEISQVLALLNPFLVSDALYQIKPVTTEIYAKDRLIDLWLTATIDSFEVVSCTHKAHTPSQGRFLNAMARDPQVIQAVSELYQCVRFPHTVAGASALIYRHRNTLWVACYYPEQLTTYRV